MNIICPHCKTKLNIPDHKIPKDKDSSFKCPKCREKVQVLLSQLNLSGKIPIKNGPAGFPIQGSGLALVCMDGTERKTKILAVVERAGFKAETPVNILEACKKMEYHIYSLVLVDESFDQNLGFKGLSIYMNELDMSLRRRACFILISERFSSGDNMAALQSSVNYIIGPDGLDHLDDILAKILLDHRDFYTVFNESMKVVGKA
jgi:predicted Zn finger-like uncharacterized protein